MAITIYHNPRCSKSREAFGIVKEFAASNNVPLEVVEYLSAPLQREQLQALWKTLGGEVRGMMRSNEDEYAALTLSEAGDDALINAIVAHPKLLQRPIVVYRGKAIIARPPELLHDFLKR